MAIVHSRIGVYRQEVHTGKKTRTQISVHGKKVLSPWIFCLFDGYGSLFPSDTVDHHEAKSLVCDS